MEPCSSFNPSRPDDPLADPLCFSCRQHLDAHTDAEAQALRVARDNRLDKPVTCEACDAGYRLASDGLHYNDARGGWTWGVCRKVVQRLREQREQHQQ